METIKHTHVIGRLTVAAAIVAALAAGALSFGVSTSMDEAGGRRNSVVKQQVADEHVDVLAGGARRSRPRGK
jgi:hypothetical protein